MQAVGIIETRGFAAALVALDIALKAANVEFLRSEMTVGVQQCMSISMILTGDVAAVQTAVEAGAAEARRMGSFEKILVIPRPMIEMKSLLNG